MLFLQSSRVDTRRLRSIDVRKLGKKDNVGIAARDSNVGRRRLWYCEQGWSLVFSRAEEPPSALLEERSPRFRRTLSRVRLSVGGRTAPGAAYIGRNVGTRRG